MKQKNSLETMKQKLSLKKESISILDQNMRKNTKGGFFILAGAAVIAGAAVGSYLNSLYDD